MHKYSVMSDECFLIRIFKIKIEKEVKKKISFNNAKRLIRMHIPRDKIKIKQNVMGEICLLYF